MEILKQIKNNQKLVLKYTLIKNEMKPWINPPQLVKMLVDSYLHLNVLTCEVFLLLTEFPKIKETKTVLLTGIFTFSESKRAYFSQVL